MMSRHVVTAMPGHSIRHAAQIMLDHKVSGVPVVDEGRLVGILTEGDLLRRIEFGLPASPAEGWDRAISVEGSARDFVKSHSWRVGDVMSKPVATVTEDMSLRDAATLMGTRGIKRLAVVRGDQLVGIVSRADLLKLIAAAKSEPVAHGDEAIRLAAETHLRDAGTVLGAQPKVTVEHGVVHLWGSVGSTAERDAAQRGGRARQWLRRCRGSPDHRLNGLQRSARSALRMTATSITSCSSAPCDRRQIARAAAAIMPTIDRPMPATTLCSAIARDRPAICSASASRSSWSTSSTTSAASADAAAPRAPMATPISAAASAGASLTPSPTIITGPCSRAPAARCRPSARGVSSATHARRAPSRAPTASRHRAPVARGQHDAGVMPLGRSDGRAPAAARRAAVRQQDQLPASRPSTATATSDRAEPGSVRRVRPHAAAEPAGDVIVAAHDHRAPSTEPLDALRPASPRTSRRAWRASGRGRAPPRPAPAATTCSTPGRAKRPAAARSSGVERRGCATISTTCGRPSVSVPVLSSTQRRGRGPSASSAPPPLTSTPACAARDMPGDERDRHGEDERAGGGDHQHGHAPGSDRRSSTRRPARAARCRQEQPWRSGRPAAPSAPCWRWACVDQPDDAGIGAVGGAAASRPGRRRRRALSRRSERLADAGMRCRQRLAGQRRLVEHGGARRDDAVDRHAPRPGGSAAVAGHDGLDRHLLQRCRRAGGAWRCAARGRAAPSSRGGRGAAANLSRSWPPAYISATTSAASVSPKARAAAIDSAATMSSPTSPAAQARDDLDQRERRAPAASPRSRQSPASDRPMPHSTSPITSPTARRAPAPTRGSEGFGR